MKNYCVTSVCDICGERKGAYFDHSKCSIIRKEKFKNAKVSAIRNRKPTKKRIKDTINAGVFFEKREFSDS